MFENKADKVGHDTGTDRRRPFRLDGDRLVIGDGKTWTWVLERCAYRHTVDEAVNINDGPD